MIRIYDLDEAKRSILKRPLANEMSYPDGLLKSIAKVFGSGVSPEEAVRKILKSVRDEGDAALTYWTGILDRMVPESVVLTEPTFKKAYSKLPVSLTRSLHVAAKRIRAFHDLQPIPQWQSEELGGVLGQRYTPIEKIGIYVPGGTAPLPSSLLMSVIPAQVAGVRQLIVCTPPDPHASILAAAHICGLKSIYLVGGAQAIAAMAYGTESVPKVDKIVGAGNLFVTLAKQQVYGVVGLDGLAGPTETMVIADDQANPEWVAADLLAQAEHDRVASAILVTPDYELAKQVQKALAFQLENLSRADIILESLTNHGGIVITPDIDTSIQLANEYAPEHLCLAVRNPQEVIEKITNAGGIFMGEYSFEVLGDYVAGPSHIMPTGGSARFSSPLNVLDFVKITSIIALDFKTSQSLSDMAAEIAKIENLSGHAGAATIRLETHRD